MIELSSFSEVEKVLEPLLPSNLKRPAYTTEHVEQFLEYIGDPQNIPKAIHVAGTSGKTSTAYYVASLLQQAGKRVGLMVSPHAEKINERVQIDLVPLDEKVFCKEISIFMGIVEESGILLTYAEVLYAFAFWEFVRQGVEYIVVEVGMGGLLDATNVIDRPDKVCIITDIGIDHTNVLGETLEEITHHKAGIIRLHNTVFLHSQEPVVMTKIQDTCRRKQADLHVGDESGSDLNLRFLPLFQRRNFALAVSTTQFVLEREGQTGLTKEQLLAAARVHVPARMEIIEEGAKILILDSAHNPQKLRALRESIEDYFPRQKIAILVGFSGGRGRQAEQLLEELEPLASHMLVTSLQDGTFHTARDVPEVMAAAEAIGLTSVEGIESLETAYAALLKRPEPILLITGSIYLISQVRHMVRGIKIQQ